MLLPLLQTKTMRAVLFPAISSADADTGMDIAVTFLSLSCASKSNANSCGKRFVSFPLHKNQEAPLLFSTP
jgi:hypothetical protein